MKKIMLSGRLHKLQQSSFRQRMRGCLLLVCMLLFASVANAQFEKPEFKKITADQHEQFSQQFEDINWTGRGLYDNTDLDDIKTNKIRAKLQAAFGNPTKTLEDLINTKGFRPGKAIQFEYWFTVNDSIPMMVLDVDGPFTDGLVFGGASKYIDLMPQIKRSFVRKLMNIEEPGDYSDYFYSPEREQWFRVEYKNGEYKTEKISSPNGMDINYDQ
ncbi:hypothetical protein [Fodinibius salinus]|nr:hypothetical protein [Fodinibius salinus]